MSSDAVALMEFATELFVGLLTALVRARVFGLG